MRVVYVRLVKGGEVEEGVDASPVGGDDGGWRKSRD